MTVYCRLHFHQPHSQTLLSVISAGLSVETVKDQLHTEAKRAALLHDQFTVKENVQREWERNYQESQQQAEKLTVSSTMCQLGSCARMTTLYQFGGVP